jgi:membrane protein DedA with SNARE-associated domain
VSGMDLSHLITLFGYPVILVGAFVEGETTLVLGGFAAHRGYLNLPLVVLCASCGAFMGDQFLFYLGRHRSRWFLDRHPDWQKRVSAVERNIDRFRSIFVLGFRFIYGLRTVSPFVLGMGDIRLIVFVVLDAVSVLVWAIVVSSLGFFFGRIIENIIGDIRHYELQLAGIILFVGSIVWTVRIVRKRRKRSSTAD